MTSFTLLLGAFVALHLLFANDPLRARLVAAMGENGFRAFYSVQSLVLLGGAILFYRQTEPEIIWVAPIGLWHLAAPAMLVAAILLVGSLTPANKAMVPHPGKAPASGVMRITRHPMMWAIAIWAVVHGTLSGSVPTVTLGFALGFLALVGASLQDGKKARQLGPGWEDYARETSWWPLGAQISGRQPWSSLWPGLWPVAGGVALWLLAFWMDGVLLCVVLDSLFLFVFLSVVLL